MAFFQVLFFSLEEALERRVEWVVIGVWNVGYGQMTGNGPGQHSYARIGSALPERARAAYDPAIADHLLMVIYVVTAAGKHH